LVIKQEIINKQNNDDKSKLMGKNETKIEPGIDHYKMKLMKANFILGKK
jgi:hypothetical protein